MNRPFSRLSSAFFGTIAAAAVLTGGGTLATAALGLTPAVLAQDQAPAQSPGAERGRMAKALMSLDLTDAQKAQIRAIIADARKQNQTVTDRDQKRANMRAAYKKVNLLLTPAQRTAMKAKLEAMRADNPTAHAQ